MCRMLSKKCSSLLNGALALFVAVMFFVPVYISLSELPHTSEEDDGSSGQGSVENCLDEPAILPPESGTSEENRLKQTLEAPQTSCERLALAGDPNHEVTSEPQDLRLKSYVCVGGKVGLKKQHCRVYSFGVKHAWERFPEAVEKDFGCRVYGFDPALDYIDHYYTKNILFFNAALDDKDQQAHYNPPAWKHRKFITLIKEMHFDDEPIDHIRLDVTLNFWPAMSTMLKDGSLLTYVKQISLEYDLNRKNATQHRQMYTLTQWLNRQGFLLAHSQPTKLSGKSFFLLYVNTNL